ncbi:MAG: hypothetical protein ACKVWR_12565 [Acidimicrobiales bacterium]
MKLRRLITLAGPLVAGYFLDGDRGAARRAKAKEQLSRLTKRTPSAPSAPAPETRQGSDGAAASAARAESPTDARPTFSSEVPESIPNSAGTTAG